MMLNYMRGEIYRLLHKKSMYIFFGSIAALYFIYVFIRAAGALNSNALESDAENFFIFLPAVAGGYLFAALYTDDLGSKNLSTIVGFGIGKAKIALCKIILMALSCAAAFGLAPVFMYVVYAAFGVAAPPDAMGAVYALALNSWLKAVVYAAMSAIAVYGVQRAAFSMVLYVLLSFGVIGQVAATALRSDMVANIAPNLDEHLISGVTTKILIGVLMKKPFVGAMVEYVAYAAASLGLAAWAFTKKELEF